MCTVIVHVPETADEPTRILAVRDEDPGRAWDPLGTWWPDAYPGVAGVRDARAGGAWLAADPRTRRLAVLLNREDVVDLTEDGLRSRGGVVLEAVAGRGPGTHPPTHGFNLVEVDGPRVAVTTWNGAQIRTMQLAPGTHMIAHDDVDDHSTPRIARWLSAFSDAQTDDTASVEWFTPWLTLLERSARLAPTDDHAIIRDNRPLGYPTLSLLVCIASVGQKGVDLAYGAFDEPGRWNALSLD